MNATLNTQAQTPTINTAPAIEHNTCRGTWGNLASWLSRSLAILTLFDSMNTQATNEGGNLQTTAQDEATTINNLSGDVANGDVAIDPGAGGNARVAWDGKADASNCPGLEWYMNHTSTVDPNIVQSIQANISDTQLTFNTKTTAIQTLLTQSNDAINSLESGDTSLLQSILTGIMGIAQNLNSIRIN